MAIFRGALNIKRRLINSLKQLLISLVLVVSVMGLVGCKEKGSTEKAGEQLDKSVEDAAKKTNELLGK
jgi:hypothetical protein